MEVPLESVVLDSVASQVRQASHSLRQVADEEILFSLLVALQVELVQVELVELVQREHRQVEVPVDVHQEPLVVVEVPWVPVSLLTCFLLFRHQEEEDRLEAVLVASLHQAVAYLCLVVQDQVEVVLEAVLAHSDHCTLEHHHCLQLGRRELEMVHLVCSSPMVPSTDILSTE